jgi:MFS transporter, DHA1 family, multidrug resistance protein
LPWQVGGQFFGHWLASGWRRWQHCLRYPKRLPTQRRNCEPLTGALIQYGTLLRDRRLLGFAGSSGFFYGGMFAYIAGTPFAYISYYHVQPQVYGLLFGIGVVGITVGNFVNSRLVMRFGSSRLLLIGTGAAAISGLVLVITAWANLGGLTGLVVPLFLFMSAAGFIVANSISGALAGFPERAGAVSALLGAIQYGCGIIGSGTPWPMALVIALPGIGSLLCARMLVPMNAMVSVGLPRNPV